MVQNKRNTSIDMLRGIVMVLMALDHTRDFFSGSPFNPLDLTKTNAAYFLTRWVTHFCAPVFVFLAGMAIRLSYLSAQKQGVVVRDQAKNLFIRGLWLVFLEVTFVRFGWVFEITYQSVALQVIWAIGVAMMVMAFWIFLPWSLVGFLGLCIIGLHNFLDQIPATAFDHFSWLWMILHEPNSFLLGSGLKILVYYPVLPWIGVMALGYAFGEIWQKAQDKRSTVCWATGTLMTVLFVVLRLNNGYGDPHPWMQQKSELFTFFSFLDCTKYPPSLLYALMTLGPSLMVLGVLEKLSLSSRNPFVIYGRVPLFFYVIHLPVIHLGGVLAKRVAALGLWPTGDGGAVFVGFGIVGVYVAWTLMVALLYIPSKWFAKVKQTSSLPILKYL